ncbi:MAG TPA: PilZ domain-containing protein [Kofleriaceae bacterium]|nr:PilZ domain-containing protein [Kofleriaceae bacterium]
MNARRAPTISQASVLGCGGRCRRTRLPDWLHRTRTRRLPQGYVHGETFEPIHEDLDPRMTTRTERLDVVSIPAEAEPRDAEEVATQPLLRIPDLDTPTERYEKKRSGRRAVVQLPAVVVAGSRRVTFVIDNLSSSGARLAGALALELGQRIAMSFVVDGVTLELAAEIVRVHTPDLLTDQIAVRFVDPPAPTVSRIEAFVAARLG